MIPFEYEKWSPWPAVWIMAILAAIVIVGVFIIDVKTPDKLDPPKDRRVIIGEDDLFTKVEEYRNDFPEFNGSRSAAGAEQLPRDFDCCRRVGNCGHGRPYGESVIQGR